MLYFKIKFAVPNQPATWREICEVKGLLSEWSHRLPLETKLFQVFNFYPDYFFVTPYLTEDRFVAFMEFDGPAYPPMPQWYDFVTYQDYLQDYPYCRMPFGPKSLKITPLSESDYDVHYHRFMRKIRSFRAANPKQTCLSA